MSAAWSNMVVGGPILAAWIAVWSTSCLSRRRRQRQQAEWERLTAGRSELDADLDRFWAEETERIRRYR